MSMNHESTFGRKLELVLENLLQDRDLKIRIDDRGIYWGPRCQCSKERFLEFSQIDDASVSEVIDTVSSDNAA